jgi:Ca-activated chloride channel family protein
VEVDGNVARVVVNEWFRAHGQALGEADYLYPLPADAAFSSFSLYQGEEELRGEIMDADRAREIYEAIVRRRRDPALVELVGSGLLRARVFPLSPGETRRVTLRFNQLLEKAGDALHLRYAGGAPNPERCDNGGPLPPNRCGPSAPPVRLEVQVPDGTRFLEPFSPTHSLETRRDGDALTIQADGTFSGPFSLFLPIAREGVGLTLATHKPLGEDGYFLLSLTPGHSDSPAVPRDLTVVLDVSGSMSGEKIEQAQGAVMNLLGTLGSRDRFRLVAFSNAVRPFDLQWRGATTDEVERATAWVRGLVADGGTNISGALEEALRLESPRDRLPVVIFLTDGIPTVGETSVEAISSQVASRRDRVRIFSFGVGHDVNTVLLDRMTEAGRGTTSYVEPGESVERALGLLTNKIRYPVLTDLELEGAPVRIREMYPVEIPDVFAGEDLVLFGRYETDGEDGRGRIALRGSRGGETLRFSLDARYPDSQEGNAFLPRLWASRKLGYLTRRIWTEGPDPELVEEIRSTALRYGLPSPYTSYLVQEPGMPWPLESPGAPPALGGVRDALPPRADFSVRGEGAVRRAKQAELLRAVTSSDELREAEEAAYPLTGWEGGEIRAVAGRLFHHQDGVWIDVQARGEGQGLEVEPYSDAYFDLLEALPELRPYAVAFTQVEIQGAGLRVRLTEGGVSTLSASALRGAKQAFRTGEHEPR